jgi:hypothetical protein
MCRILPQFGIPATLAIGLSLSFKMGKNGPPLAGNTESSLKPFEGIAQVPTNFGLSKNRSEWGKEVSPTRLGSRPADFGGGKLGAFERTFLENSQAGNHGAIGQVRRALDMAVAVFLLGHPELRLEHFHELLHAVLLSAKLLECLQNLAQL